MTDVRDNIPGPGMPDTVALEYVRDRHGLIWRVVRDGGMAATVDYAGKNHSAGIKWLEQEHGPLVPVLSCIANDPTCPCRDGDACHYVAYPGSPAVPLPPPPRCGVKGCTLNHGPDASWVNTVGLETRTHFEGDRHDRWTVTCLRHPSTGEHFVIRAAVDHRFLALWDDGIGGLLIRCPLEHEPLVRRSCDEVHPENDVHHPGGH